jgi:beta-glucosidase
MWDAENPQCYVPVMETPEHVQSARKAFLTENGGLLIPVIQGDYDPDWLKLQGADAPKIESGDMQQISRPLDHVALNIYTGTYVRSNGQRRL